MGSTWVGQGQLPLPYEDDTLAEYAARLPPSTPGMALLVQSWGERFPHWRREMVDLFGDDDSSESTDAEGAPIHAVWPPHPSLLPPTPRNEAAAHAEA